MVPQSRALPVLITRPEPQASRFRQAVIDRYGDRANPILCPLMAPVFLAVQIEPGAYASVIFTSETAVQAARTLALPLPNRAYCVGNRTAEVAQQAGFDAISANGSAADLSRLLCDHPDHAPFLHLHGRETAGDVAEGLKKVGIKVESRVLYDQESVPLSKTVKLMLQSPGPVVVPLFSPRSARLFGAAMVGLTLQATLHMVVLSPAVAQAIAQAQVNLVIVAAEPTQNDLLLAMDHCFLNA